MKKSRKISPSMDVSRSGSQETVKGITEILPSDEHDSYDSESSFSSMSIYTMDSFSTSGRSDLSESDYNILPNIPTYTSKELDSGLSLKASVSSSSILKSPSSVVPEMKEATTESPHKETTQRKKKKQQNTTHWKEKRQQKGDDGTTVYELNNKFVKKRKSQKNKLVDSEVFEYNEEREFLRAQVIENMLHRSAVLRQQEDEILSKRKQTAQRFQDILEKVRKHRNQILENNSEKTIKKEGSYIVDILNQHTDHSKNERTVIDLERDTNNRESEAIDKFTDSDDMEKHTDQSNKSVQC